MLPRTGHACPGPPHPGAVCPLPAAPVPHALHRGRVGKARARAPLAWHLLTDCFLRGGVLPHLPGATIKKSMSAGTVALWGRAL